jgi:plastocyanin
MAPPAAAVTIQNFAFSPASVTVPTGTTVTWTNRDSAPHQVGSDTGAFQGGALGTGASYSFTFTTPGTFPYHCVIHPSMHGTVTVT